MSSQEPLYYSRGHEWTTGTEGVVLVGISGHAVEQLGDMVFLELPEKGDEFSVGETFGTIESTKTVSDLYMPVSGRIVAVNDDLLSDPASLQDDPYLDGWLVKVQASGGSDELMNHEEYEVYIEGS